MNDKLKVNIHSQSCKHLCRLLTTYNVCPSNHNYFMSSFRSFFSFTDDWTQFYLCTRWQLTFYTHYTLCNDYNATTYIAYILNLILTKVVVFHLTGKCSNYYFPCDESVIGLNETLCIHRSRHCDKVFDCPNREDEKNCGTYQLVLQKFKFNFISLTNHLLCSLHSTRYQDQL